MAFWICKQLVKTQSNSTAETVYLLKVSTQLKLDSQTLLFSTKENEKEI